MTLEIPHVKRICAWVAWKCCLKAVSVYAHILEKLPTKVPTGPESWEGDRIRTATAERGSSSHTWLVGVHSGTVLWKAVCHFSPKLQIIYRATTGWGTRHSSIVMEEHGNRKSVHSILSRAKGKVPCMVGLHQLPHATWETSHFRGEELEMTWFFFQHILKYYCCIFF